MSNVECRLYVHIFVKKGKKRVDHTIIPVIHLAEYACHALDSYLLLPP